MKQAGKIWTDSSGNEIPAKVVSQVLKTEEKHSHRIVRAAVQVEKNLQKLVELVRNAYDEVYTEKVKIAKIKGNKTSFGGMTISSFDGSVEVKITKPDNMYFDTAFTEMVKTKFQEYFNSLEVQDNEIAEFLRNIVNDLLFTSGGKLDQNKVFQLRKYRTELSTKKQLSKSSELFIEAVDLFDKAVRMKKGNTGIYVSVRNEDTGKMERVKLKYTDI